MKFGHAVSPHRRFAQQDLHKSPIASAKICERISFSKTGEPLIPRNGLVAVYTYVITTLLCTEKLYDYVSQDLSCLKMIYRANLASPLVCRCDRKSTLRIFARTGSRKVNVGGQERNQNFSTVKSN